jgi:hypothetical protein
MSCILSTIQDALRGIGPVCVTFRLVIRGRDAGFICVDLFLMDFTFRHGQDLKVSSCNSCRSPTS